MIATATPANAATAATLTGGVLTVTGDNQDNAITISRNMLRPTTC